MDERAREVTRPLIQVAEVALGRQRSPAHERGDHMVSYLRSANVGDGKLVLDDVKQMNFEPAEQKTFALTPGDVLVTEGSGSRETVGQSAVWHGELHGPTCFQNTLLRIRPRDGIADGRFLAWWARHAHASRLMASVASGANILHLSAEELRRLPVPDHSIDVQRRIADFLDDQVTRIDKIIASRRKQLSMISELRESELDALINDPSLPWTRLARFASIQSGVTIDAGRRFSNETEVPYLRVANVQAGALDLSEVKTILLQPDQVPRYLLRDGDVLMTEGGDLDKLGRGTVWRCQIPRAVHQNHVFAVRVDQSALLPEYLAHVTSSTTARCYFESTGNRSTNLASTSATKVLDLMTPIRSLRDQQLVIDRLAEVDSFVQSGQSSLQRTVGLLDELKRSLITSAVTGEFDVSSADGSRAFV